MDVAEYIRIIRARWLIVAAAVITAVVAAWLTSTVAPIATPSPTFAATTLLVAGSPNPNIPPLPTIAALARIEPVAERAAEDLGFEGNPRVLAADVRGVAHITAGTLAITATASEPRSAERLADAFAQALLDYLSARKSEAINAQLEAMSSQLSELDDEIARLDRQIASGSSNADLLTALRNAKISSYGTLQQQYQTALSAQALPVGIDVVQNAKAREVSGGGLQPPRSPMARVIIAAFLGLVLGAGIALLIERMHPRIRTRAAAAKHYGIPVIAEIPRFPRRDRGQLVTSVSPRSAAANAFRLLTAGLSRRQLASSSSRAHQSARAILITSLGPNEGKTTVVANLAVAFAESGKSVLILSCDFTRPRIHILFGVPKLPGLADSIADLNGKPILSDCLYQTQLPDVSVVASGSRPENPGELLSSAAMRSVVKEARRLAHIVLIDTAPLLAEADAAHLLSDVDAVLVVAREGYTTVDLAERASDILERLAAPVAGVVLNDATEGDMPRYYFPPDVVASPSRNDDVSQEADTAREAETSQGIDTSQDADSSTGMAETSRRKRVGGIPN